MIEQQEQQERLETVEKRVERLDTRLLVAELLSVAAIVASVFLWGLVIGRAVGN